MTSNEGVCEMSLKAPLSDVTGESWFAMVASELHDTAMSRGQILPLTHKENSSENLGFLSDVNQGSIPHIP